MKEGGEEEAQQGAGETRAQGTLDKMRNGMQSG